MRAASGAFIGGTLLAIFASGCATTEPGELQQQLQTERDRNRELQSSVSDLRSQVGDKDRALAQRDDAIRSYEERMQAGAGQSALLPPNAKPGECYARVFMPPQYATETETVLKRAAAKEVSVTKPQYEWTEKEVLVREASKKLEVIPAKYDWVEETVLVKEASERLEVVPAVYDWVEEQVLVQPAYTTWKKGRGPIERIDEATGEIMCLVEVPAVYNTVKKRVQVQPPTTRKVEIPAEYRTVRKRVLVEPPKTVEVEIPAQYKSVRVMQMVQGPQEVESEIPAEYQTVTKRKLVREGALEWRPILCETNTTPDVIRKLQRSLRNAGYRPGPIDGVAGSQTMAAVSQYQSDQGMARGKLTIETLRKLRVM